MRTRLVRVRRKRPMRVMWAVALMLIALCGYLWVGVPATRQATSTQLPIVATARPAAVTGERVTEDVRLASLALYAIQLGAFEDADAAKVEAARYVRRGAAGYVYEDGVIRVLGSGYATRAEAEQVVKRLKSDEEIDAAVYESTAESVLLRVTATRGQISALSAADLALRDGADALIALSFSLDKGETELQDAAAKTTELASTIESARDELKAQAGDAPNAVAAGLIELLTAFERGLSASTSGGTQTLLDFSSRLKYNYLDVRLKHIAYVNGLNG